MAKKKLEKPKRELTRRQLSHWQRQRRRQRIIIGFGALIIVSALGLVGAGLYYQWYLPEYKPLHQTVVEVNGTKFNMQYCIDAAKFQLGEYYSYAEYYFDYVIKAIEQSELIKQGAKELGFTVSSAEVKEALEGYGYDDIPAVRDAIRVQLLLTKLSDEYFEKQVPQSAEQRHIMAMFLESESQVNEVKARLEAGEDFADLAAELSLDDTCKEKSGDLGWRPEGALYQLIGSSVLEENAFTCEVGTLSQPIYEADKSKAVGYWLIKVLEKREDTGEIHVQAILLSSEEQAQSIRARLEAGEDFAALAEEFSQWSGASEDKGDLGWLTPGSMSAAFDKFVFNPETELDTISEPIADETVTTKGGYWLIKVVAEDDNRQIDEENRDMLKSDALNKWVAALWDNPDNNVVSYLDDEMKAFAVARISEG